MSVVWRNDVPGSRWIETARIGLPSPTPGAIADYWYTSPRLSDDVGAAYGFPKIAVAASGARTITWQEESAVPGVPEIQVMRLTPEDSSSDPTPSPRLAHRHQIMPFRSCTRAE